MGIDLILKFKYKLNQINFIFSYFKYNLIYYKYKNWFLDQFKSYFYIIILNIRFNL